MPNLIYHKKTIKSIVQRDIQINVAKIRTEKLNINLGNIKFQLPLIFRSFFTNKKKIAIIMKATIMANPKRMISKIFSNIFLRLRFRAFLNRLLIDFHQIIYHNGKEYYCTTRIKDYFRYMFLIHNRKSPRFYNAKFREKFYFYFLDDSHLHQLNK